jgi:hypothetical protein
MKRAFVVLSAFLAVAAPARAGWSGARLWNDNRAEVAVYDAERVVDEKPRPFRETLIISRVELNVNTLTEAEKAKRHETVTALKFNTAGRVEGANYPRSYLTSVYARADNPATVHKISAGGQDWMGNRFRIYTSTDGEDGTLTGHTYLPPDGDRTVFLDRDQADLFEDDLPLALRAMPLDGGFELKTRLWSSLAEGAALEPQSSTAVIKVAGEDLVHCHAGAINCWKVTVDRQGSVDTYWMEKSDPHILVRMETADGRKRVLYARARWSYWDKRLPRPNILN